MTHSLKIEAPFEALGTLGQQALRLSHAQEDGASLSQLDAAIAAFLADIDWSTLSDDEREAVTGHDDEERRAIASELMLGTVALHHCAPGNCPDAAAA